MKKKKIIIPFIILIIILSFTNSSYALLGLDNIFETGSEWLVPGRTNMVNRDDAYNDANRIAGILWIVGIFAFLIAGAAMGIKYMFAATADEKADIKKSLIPLLVGGGIVLGALTIWQIMLKFFDNII